jgi:predicted O-methyltransferase YrrM
MSTQKVAAWSHAEEFVTPEAHVEEAERRGEELGARPVGNGVGATLRLLAAAIGAKAVMEIGTGAGASGLWLLGGMPDDGILTTIDPETEHQRAARDAFAAAGFAHQRTRVIAGRALEVLPRMTDGAYDLVVVVDADRREYPDHVEQGARLLRRGGTLVLTWSDSEADPANRDPETRTLREVGRSIRERDDFVTALLPVGEGLLVAVKR